MNFNPTDFISNEDLERFTHYLNPKITNFIFYESDLKQVEDLDLIFHDGNYFAILFRENPETNVGHWILFIKHSESHFEYFDCLGDKPPDNIMAILNELAQKTHDVSLEFLTTNLMGHKNNECGKYVMLRINSLPTSLKDFNKFFQDIKKKYSPDAFIKLFYNLPL